MANKDLTGLSWNPGEAECLESHSQTIMMKLKVLLILRSSLLRLLLLSFEQEQTFKDIRQSITFSHG